jgi:hypothetical protein
LTPKRGANMPAYSYATIDYLGVPPTSSYGINDGGEIVGFYYDGGASTYHGFLYSGGTYTSFDVPAAGAYDGTFAYGINATGDIVGNYGAAHGFFYSDGTYTTFDDPLAGPGGTYAYGINVTDDIVGVYYDTTYLVHGYLYSGGTTVGRQSRSQRGLTSGALIPA